MSAVPAGSWTIEKTGTEDDGGELFVLAVVDTASAGRSAHPWTARDEMSEGEVIALLKEIGVSDVAIAAALHKARERFGPPR
jgi:hypothetical protein